ncbi:MAG TPA: redoxin domain-containing protein [Pyrinomonadaceae bacterium]|nr:redoxin domain-containing protein [Pyrinomonadaceae bacterium]
MRIYKAFILVLVLGFTVLSQDEQAPIVEKEFEYRDWTMKNIEGGEINLRSFAAGKKLVMVVYWAPWCLNWNHDAAFVEGLHQKYAKDGLGVIGVGLYDPVSSMKRHQRAAKLTFPSVYEATALSERLTSDHYARRRASGDNRKWGTPWYVFLEPDKLQSGSDVLASKLKVVNGELIRVEAEKFIQEKLGLAVSASSQEKKDKIEACEPAAALTKP